MCRFFTFIGLLSFFINMQTVAAQSTTTGSFLHGGLTREYRLYVPASYNPSNPAPLVLNLHGYGSINWQQELYGDFRAIADTAGFVIVHPNGTMDITGSLFWNVGFAPSDIDDIGFLTALMDTISAHYNIDQQRIYSTGMSNGGFMSYLMACQSDRIAAIASVTGTMTDPTYNECQPSRPVPVMEIHGTADDVVPYNGQLNFKPIPQVLDYWVSFNNCTPDPEVNNVPDSNPGDGATAEHFLYTGGDNGATVEHYKINNGGHTWPGAIFDIGVTCKDFSASQEIWRFFRQYSLTTKTENIQPLSISIFPNPVTDIMHMQCMENSPVHIKLLDIRGKLLMEKAFENQAVVDMSIYPAGMYFLECNLYGVKRMEKVVKL